MNAILHLTIKRFRVVSNISQVACGRIQTQVCLNAIAKFFSLGYTAFLTVLTSVKSTSICLLYHGPQRTLGV